MYLKLIRPTCEYADQIMQYKDDMLANNDSFDGCAGLEEVDSFTEWIDFENRLKRNMFLQRYFGEFELKMKRLWVLLIIDTLYHLFYCNMVEILVTVFCPQSVRRDMPVKC